MNTRASAKDGLNKIALQPTAAPAYEVSRDSLFRLKDGKRELLCRHPGSHERCIENAEAARLREDGDARQTRRHAASVVSIRVTGLTEDRYDEESFP